MIIKSIFPLLISMAVLSFTSCRNHGCHWAAEPPVFLFQIKYQGQNLADSVLNKIKISDETGEVKTNINVTVATDSSGIIMSRQIGTFKNKTFIIAYPYNLENDTLLVSNLLPSPATDCQYIIRKVAFNRQLIQPDTVLFDSKPVYVFYKQ